MCVFQASHFLVCGGVSLFFNDFFLLLCEICCFMTEKPTTKNYRYTNWLWSTTDIHFVVGPVLYTEDGSCYALSVLEPVKRDQAVQEPVKLH